MPHLTLAARSEAGNGLRSNRGGSAIARSLKEARSTVMLEILSHCVPSDKGAKGHVTNRCITRCECDRKYLRAVRPSHMQNLTQHLPWEEPRGKKMRNRMRDLRKNAHCFTLKCVYFCEGAFTLSSYPAVSAKKFLFVLACGVLAMRDVLNSRACHNGCSGLLWLLCV